MSPSKQFDNVSQHNEHVTDDSLGSAELPTVLAEHVSYGPNGVRGLIASPYVFGAAALASLGGFSWGYDQGVISIINVMPQFHQRFPETNPDHPHSGFYTGFMTGMLEFGAFLGCFFMPWLCDKISRKWALSAVVVIFNIGAIIQTAATNYPMLVAGRTIGGVGVGTLAMVRCLFSKRYLMANDWLTGRTTVHFRNCATQPERCSTCPRTRLCCTRSCYCLLDHICDSTYHRRSILPSPIRSADGLCNYSRCNYPLLSILSSLAGSCGS